MKNVYRICLNNFQHQLVAYRVTATSLAAAIAAAQNKAQVDASVDPVSTSNEGPIDIEVA